MRSLYQCSHAQVELVGNVKWQVLGLRCVRGHEPLAHANKLLTYADLKNGDSLDCDTCTDCADYSDNGDKINYKGDRGW